MTASTGQPAAPGPREHLLTGRALITGGTSGIGLSFAHALAARGCDLVLVARDAARLTRTADQLRWRYGVAVEALPADLSRRDGTDAVAARLTDPGAAVDILVNNAGRGLHTSLLAPDVRDHDEAIDLMVRAVLVLGGAAARAMRARGHGLVINVASVQALVTMGAYSALKSWTLAYSEALALELAGTDVQVTTLLPGWVRTGFQERAGADAGRLPGPLWLEPDRVVAECLADVARGKDRSIPSRRYKVLAFLAVHAPRPVVRAVVTRIVRARKG
ncbi:SDR family NAD(P)-dependent oxidoreductase [Georgenia sp. TF02-10]|uniref:SDR family NAD(P)-dependent oxidoreductase n=1 Tax=Georgenia sp. TF02-10 TaxID=2917725 RepID=UPI001FA73117|nr:SDR family NAD(P)-dependent oxidoreductase [Georgenia sp. TF02-10]UNX55310.1 SDR family NAD(P)-dependent oxidoreductase [Georgenia sp. TF02-10]